MTEEVTKHKFFNFCVCVFFVCVFFFFFNIAVAMTPDAGKQLAEVWGQ
jgi:hypothetical protein